VNKNYDYEDLMKMAFKVVQEAEADAKKNPTSEMIQIVIVEPFKKPYKKTIPNTLDAMKEIVGGYIENLFIGRTDKDARVGIVLNEEGKLIDLPMNRRLLGSQGVIDFIVGTFFITAYNLQGENISLTDEEAEKFIKRFTAVEVYV
jgi:hypothetical protein